MRKLILLLSVVFFAFNSNANTNFEENNCINEEEFFASCYVTYTTTQFNPDMNTYITTTHTQYLGEVDYGSHGFNVAACQGRAERFLNSLSSL